MVDVIVIGGGLVGIATAYHLVQAGAKTLLVDRADAGRATDAGAGILSPETNTRDPEAWVTFATQAVRYYPQLIAQLEAEHSGDTGYAVCGMLLVASGPEELEVFQQARQVILGRQARQQHPAVEDLREVSPAEAKGMFPALGAVAGAIYYRQAARVDGRLLSRAMLRVAEQKGLAIQTGDVERLEISNRQVQGVVVDGQSLAAPRVVIAGGAWSPEFGNQLGVMIPVKPQRGQIIHLRLAASSTLDSETGHWPIISGFRGHYILPWPGGRVVVGATRESEAGFVPRTTAAGVLEVLSEALRLAPGLAVGEILEMRVGLRPLSADTLPILGPVPQVAGVYLATGHGPTGLQLGPLSGKIVADLVLGRSAEVDIQPFLITRFG